MRFARQVRASAARVALGERDFVFVCQRATFGGAVDEYEEVWNCPKFGDEVFRVRRVGPDLLADDPDHGLWMDIDGLIVYRRMDEVGVRFLGGGD